MIISLKEYCEKENISKPAALYRIKNNTIKAKKDKKGKWQIEIEDEDKTDYRNELEKAQMHIEHLEQRLQDKEMIIEAERRTNIALLSSLEQYKSIEHGKKSKSPFKRLLALFK